MHDQTAMRTEGITEQLRLHPQVKTKANGGYRGLPDDFPNQVQAPPRKPKDEAPLGEKYIWREARRRQSSARICVEHTTGEEKKWRTLRRYLGPRESYAETHAPSAALVSDRAARRPTWRRTSTELVLAHRTACSPPGLPVGRGCLSGGGMHRGVGDSSRAAYGEFVARYGDNFLAEDVDVLEHGLQRQSGVIDDEPLPLVVVGVVTEL
jgi:hypothetical protein